MTALTVAQSVKKTNKLATVWRVLPLLGLVVALGCGGGDASNNEDGGRTSGSTPEATSNNTNGETTNVIAPESLSPDPIEVQTNDTAEAIEQIYTNYFNGVNAGTLNAVYDRYAQFYVNDQTGEMANNLRNNAKAIAAQQGSIDKGANEKLISVEVNPTTIEVHSATEKAAVVTRTYSVTNTEASSKYVGGVDITKTYRQAEKVVLVQKQVNGKNVWVFSEETDTLSQDLVSTTEAEHKPY